MSRHHVYLEIQCLAIAVQRIRAACDEIEKDIQEALIKSKELYDREHPSTDSNA